MTDSDDQKWNEFQLQVLDNVRTYGWHVQGVFDHKGVKPDWCYTVGLTLKWMPELILAGLPMNGAAGMLNRIAELAIAGEIALVAGQVIRREELAGEYGLYLLDVPDPWQEDKPLGVARMMEAAIGGVRALQVVWPDDQYRWPWVKGFVGTQPLWGPPPALRLA